MVMDGRSRTARSSGQRAEVAAGDRLKTPRCAPLSPAPARAGSSRMVVAAPICCRQRSLVWPQPAQAARAESDSNVEHRTPATCVPSAYTIEKFEPVGRQLRALRPDSERPGPRPSPLAGSQVRAEPVSTRGRKEATPPAARRRRRPPPESTSLTTRGCSLDITTRERSADTRGQGSRRECVATRATERISTADRQGSGSYTRIGGLFGLASPSQIGR